MNSIAQYCIGSLGFTDGNDSQKNRELHGMAQGEAQVRMYNEMYASILTTWRWFLFLLPLLRSTCGKISLTEKWNTNDGGDPYD